MRLPDALHRAASRSGNKSALEIHGKRTISFSDLDQHSTALAQGLIAEGLQPGDRVAILAGHDIDALVLFWGILKASGSVVWLNEQSDAQTLAAITDNAAPARIFVQTEKMRASVAANPALAIPTDLLGCVGELRALGRQQQSVLPAGDEHDVAAIVYTSGSSGAPKGVCLTHRNLLSVAEAVIEHMPITADDSYLMVVPLHYVHGMMQLLVHAIAGATVFLSGGFMFPRKIVDLLATTRVTGFSGVPYHFNALIDRGGFLAASLPDLQWLTVTGGKLPAERISQITDAMPDVAFHVAYGQTECAPRATALQPSKLLAKPESVGSAIPGVSVLLLDEEGEEVATGDAGEVVIAGPNVMAGYWRDPAGSDAVIDAAGRLHTGDIGRLDEEGDLFLLGRRTAMIKSAGERIFPAELEQVLEQHARVEEAIVVGVDDPLYGQRVVAHVLVDGIGEGGAQAELIAEISAHCLAQVQFARAPREYHCWASFPRKANGKPDRQAVMLQGDPDAS